MAKSCGRALGGHAVAPVRVLLIPFYFPPAGGGGVQRPLKLAEHLAGFGFETHVLAPTDPRWLHRDQGLAVASCVRVHRAPFVGPQGRLPAEELYGTHGFDRLARRLAQGPSQPMLTASRQVVLRDLRLLDDVPHFTDVERAQVVVRMFPSEATASKAAVIVSSSGASRIPTTSYSPTFAGLSL